MRHRGVFRPRCRFEAVHRYGRSLEGRPRHRRRLRGRRFTASMRAAPVPEQRPCRPASGRPLHAAMRCGVKIRFRCRAYPACRTCLKKPSG
ncbi:MAG: hypothetical protein WHT06_03970 [Desulfobacterales bacterium]